MSLRVGVPVTKKITSSRSIRTSPSRRASMGRLIDKDMSPFYGE